MNIESKKIKTPFSPNEQYFVDLAARIQKRVGIEVEEIKQESPKIELNKKQKPLQLTVEFGYPLTAEKNTPEVTVETSDIIELAPEVTSVTPQPISVTPQPIIEAIEEVKLADWESVSEIIEVDSNHTDSLIESSNEIIENTPQISGVDVNHSIEVIEMEEVTNPNLNSELVASETFEISETVVSPYFSDADLDRLHEQMHNDDVSAEGLNQEVAVESTLITNQITNQIEEISSSNQNDLVNSDKDTLPVSSTGDFENAFTDAELDLLHDLHTQENERNTIPAAQIDHQHVVVENKFSTESEHSSPEKSEKTIKIPSDSRIIDRENQAAKVKPSFMEMIPWSTVFGMVASLMAVASAWFIWNSIQKPVAIDALIDQAVVANPAIVENPSNSEVIEEGIQIDELTPSQQVTYELIDNSYESDALKSEKFDFKKMSEKSKVSSVELEKNGLTVLELEDPIFDEVTL